MQTGTGQETTVVEAPTERRNGATQLVHVIAEEIEGMEAARMGKSFPECCHYPPESLEYGLFERGFNNYKAEE